LPTLRAPRLQQFVLARQHVGNRGERFDALSSLFRHQQFIAVAGGTEASFAGEGFRAAPEEIDHLPLDYRGAITTRKGAIAPLTTNGPTVPAFCLRCPSSQYEPFAM